MIRVTIMEEEFGVVITTAPARASYREIELERDCYVPHLMAGTTDRRGARS